MHANFPILSAWIKRLQERPVYRQMVMDFHTPMSYIPAQIGFEREYAFAFGTTENECSKLVDNGPHIDIPQEVIGFPESEAYYPRQEAMWRLYKFHDKM